MKKVIAFVLALVMCLSLCACGEPTKDELIDSAVIFEQSDYESMMSNLAKASTYIGGTYEMQGLVESVAKDYCVVAPVYDFVDENQYAQIDTSVVEIRVYLPVEELINLEYYDMISFIGTITEVNENNSTIYPEFSSEIDIYGVQIVVNPAYLV